MTAAAAAKVALVTGAAGGIGGATAARFFDGGWRVAAVDIAAPGTKARNPGFDITPARLVTGLITERGVLEASREALQRAFPERARHAEAAE